MGNYRLCGTSFFRKTRRKGKTRGKWSTFLVENGENQHPLRNTGSDRCFSGEISMKFAKIASGASRSLICGSTEREFSLNFVIFWNFMKILMEFRDTCTGFLLNSEKSVISWRSCDLDRSESRRIQWRNAKKFLERSEFQKKIYDFMWIHRPLHPQGKTKAKWDVRNC